MDAQTTCDHKRARCTWPPNTITHHLLLKRDLQLRAHSRLTSAQLVPTATSSTASTASAQFEDSLCRVIWIFGKKEINKNILKKLCDWLKCIGRETVSESATSFTSGSFCIKKYFCGNKGALRSNKIRLCEVLL